MGMQTSLAISPRNWLHYMKPCFEATWGPCRDQSVTVYQLLRSRASGPTPCAQNSFVGPDGVAAHHHIMSAAVLHVNDVAEATLGSHDFIVDDLHPPGVQDVNDRSRGV